MSESKKYRLTFGGVDLGFLKDESLEITCHDLNNGTIKELKDFTFEDWDRISESGTKISAELIKNKITKEIYDYLIPNEEIK